MAGARVRTRTAVCPGALLILALAGWGMPVGAESPVPGASASPSGVPAGLHEACARLAGLLPAEFTGEPLRWVASVDDESPATQNLRRLLTAGLADHHVCGVAFHYGDREDAPGALMFQVPGSAPGAALEAYIAVVIADATFAFTRSEVTLAGRPAVRIEASHQGEPAGGMVLYTVGDVVVVGTARPAGSAAGLFEAVVAVLPAPGESLPKVTAPPVLAPSPTTRTGAGSS